MLARTCATAFTRRLLYSRGTPGIVCRSRPTAKWTRCVFGDRRGRQAPRAAYRDGCSANPSKGPLREFLGSIRKHALICPWRQAGAIVLRAGPLQHRRFAIP
jgi:hypothetical protein